MMHSITNQIGQVECHNLAPNKADWRPCKLCGLAYTPWYQLQDMNKDALEIRTYLHDRLLMEYADALEASGKNLQELLTTSPTELHTAYKMRRGHVARFLDRGSVCKPIQMPKHLVLPARKVTAKHRNGHKPPSEKLSPVKSLPEDVIMASPRKENLHKLAFDQVSEASRNSTMTRVSIDSARPSSFMEPPEFKSAAVLLRPTSGREQGRSESKGIFSAPAVEPRFCGLVKARGLLEEVTSLAILEKIMVQKLAPAHTKGVKPFRSKDRIPMAPPFKASDLWAESPTIILCLRRPGCVMCRAEAHQLYSRKPIFDAMGIQLVACLNEYIDAEVRAFWPRYWGGMVVVDEQRDFFKALGQGKLPKEGFVSGFLFNAAARANYKRATSTGVEGNFAGEGTIKGGLYIMRPGSGGVAYQFVERNFGDWAPLDEVLQVCSDIMQRR
ncbi:hypothetical protein M758_5G037900 [Ceratodon purpureus]|nr:hypothetical protein M758_5G037900 [Ceratodon purpureus]